MKKILCLALLTGSLMVPLGASAKKEPTFTQKAYNTLINTKDMTFSFIKEHPYLTMACLITMINPKMREMAYGLPKTFWNGVQQNPIPTAVMSGFFLSIMLQ